MKLTGKVSHFGGPDDMGVSPSEGLAFIFDVSDQPSLFLPSQPPGTTGLARRLDPDEFYIACRWDYDAPDQSKKDLLKHMALVQSPKTGKQFLAMPGDWGPHGSTDRVADISPGLMSALGIETDDTVTVIYPYGDVEEKIMPYERIVISSGHGLKVRGASGIIDEVDEARKVVEAVADELRERGVEVKEYHDDTSTSQSQNLNAIVNYHNAQARDLDVSVHFNAFEQVEKPMGCEVLYLTQSALASQLSAAIAAAGGFINRGGKKRTDLKFLNSTEMPSVLLEVCFVDSETDCNLYNEQFDEICRSIADTLGGTITDVDEEGGEIEPPPVTPAEVPRVDIEVSGEVLIFVNGTQIGTKG